MKEWDDDINMPRYLFKINQLYIYMLSSSKYLLHNTWLAFNLEVWDPNSKIHIYAFCDVIRVIRCIET